jgi:hypothetical protein
MRKVAEYLREKYGPWGWIGQRAHDAAGINQVLPLDFIISCNYGTDIPYYFREEDVFAAEKTHRVRRDWSNEDLNASLEGSVGHEIFERWGKCKKKVNLICYRSLKRLERGDHLFKNPKIYAAPEKLKKHFDNKILLYKNLPKLGLPRIPGRVERPGKVTFKDLRKELSLPFVVQFPYGSSGHFTFIIKEEKEYNALRRKYPSSFAVMRRYIKTFSLNGNAVIVTTDKGC